MPCATIVGTLYNPNKMSGSHSKPNNHNLFSQLKKQKIKTLSNNYKIYIKHETPICDDINEQFQLNKI